MTVYDMIRLVEVMKMDIIDRLKYYEPLFNNWIVDELISSDEDISFVKVVKESYNANERKVLKVRTLLTKVTGDEKQIMDDLQNQYHNYMLQYDHPEDYLDLPYLQEEHYYIEEDDRILGMDICFLMKGSMRHESIL